MSYPMLYNLQIKVYQMLEYLQYRRCRDCDEIMLDGDVCDYCSNHANEPEKTTAKSH